MPRQIFLASDPQHLEFLAAKIRQLDEKQTRAFMSTVMGFGLMRTSRWLHWLAKIIRWRYRNSEFRTESAAWGRLFIQLSRIGHYEIVEHMRDSMIEHLLHGEDEYSPLSAGGFSQWELDRIVSLLALASGVTKIEE